MFRGIAAKLVGGRRSQFAKGTRGIHMEEPNKPAPGGEEYYAEGGNVDDDREGASGLAIGYDQSPYGRTGKQNIGRQTYAKGGHVEGDMGKFETYNQSYEGGYDEGRIGGGRRGGVEEDGLEELGDRDEGRRDHGFEEYLSHGGEAENERTAWNEQEDDDMDQDEQNYAMGGVAGNGPDSSGVPAKKRWHENYEPGLGVGDQGTQEHWSRGIDPMVMPGGRDARVLAQKTMDGLDKQDHPAGENRERIDAAWEAVGHRKEWDKSDMRGTAFSSHEEGMPGAEEDEENFASGGMAGEEESGGSGMTGGDYNDGSGEDADEEGGGSAALTECAKEAIHAMKMGDAKSLARALKDFVELADED